MKHILISAIILFSNIGLIGQDVAIYDHKLYDLAKEFSSGKKEVFWELLNYFDSEEIVIESLGYHRIKRTESSVAKQIIFENCYFLKSEIGLADTKSKSSFSDFLTSNFDKIFWSDIADAFLITPLEQREIKYDVVELSEAKRNKFISESQNRLNSPRLKKRQQDLSKLLANRDSKALLKIAQIILSKRLGKNPMYYSGDWSSLLQALTHTTIAVPNANGDLIYKIESDFSRFTRINLLIFFAKNYKQYQWDKEKSIFVHSEIKVRPISPLRALLESLWDKDDSVAFNAFLELSTSDHKGVSELVDEYKSLDMNLGRNLSFHRFALSFLREITVLTNYCDKNNIDFKGSPKLRNYLHRLQEDIPFKQRYQLENEIASKLSLQEITAFEYWCFILDEKPNLRYSAGRILDMAYSRSWNELLSDSVQLKLYLKKSWVFSRLGFASDGVCGSYLVKFTNSSEKTIQKISEIRKDDEMIQEQIDKILELNHNQERNPITQTPTKSESTYVPDLEIRLQLLTQNVQDSVETEGQIRELISHISFEQIGTALKGIEDYKFKYYWLKYSFLNSDWGLMIDKIPNNQTVSEFILNYESRNEYELYSHYLDKGEIDYKNIDGSLNYYKIYQMLKYDIVTPFISMSYTYKDPHIYSLIKLLELTFQTTLGFPSKLCESKGIYHCESGKRALKWLNYIEENELISIHEPVSFNYKQD